MRGESRTLMTKIRKVDKEVVKNLNRQIILNYIRKYQEISRIDLAQHTKLSPTTVSTITSELIEKGIITELRIGESNGGRRPVMFGINPNSKYVITIILTPKGITYTLVDLKCQIVEKKYIPCKAQGQESVIEIIIKSIEDIKSKFANIYDKICGIGISIPGVIDLEGGKILYSSRFKLNNFDLTSVIKEKTGIYTCIFKDTDALILGEHKFGVGDGRKNFAYIIVENGVGMSYINSGKLFKPGYGGGFELGHITIDSNGPECVCGNRGCLGTMVSETPVLNRLDKLIEKGYVTDIKDTSNMHLIDVVEYSNRGDKAARYVLEEQARLLGTAVATVINLLNPQLIALGGPLSKCRWGFLEILQDTVSDRALQIYSRRIDIKFAILGEESALKGMANEVYEKEIFKPVEF
jgi:Transcriptional regulator/sugar kinase